MQANNTQTPVNITKVFLFFVLALFGLLMLVNLMNQNAVLAVDTAAGHGVAKHKDTAVMIQDCLKQKGALQLWVNPTTGRRASICQISVDTFGIQVIELKDGDWKEVTSFLKSKMTRIDQVMQYLRNAGYTPIK
jgi:hypothetical protein